MKLAAAAILSLVAIATYASPAAYSENQVSAEYSAANEPVIVHLEKRTGKQPRLIQDMIIKDNKDYYKNNNKDSEKKSIKDIKNNKDIKKKSIKDNDNEDYIYNNKDNEKNNKDIKNIKDYKTTPKTITKKTTRATKTTTRTATKTTRERGKIPKTEISRGNSARLEEEYIHDKKRPDFVKPSEEILAQLGTTNQPMDARVKSWKEMGDGKAPHKRSKYRQEFYQNQEDEYRKLMQRPKIIKTESPEHLKSGLKKGYTGPVHGRKVGFKPVVKLALYDRFDEQSDGGQSDDEDPSQSQDFTEGTTDTTGEQSDNQPTFETHEIPINDPGYYW
ncbi:hypothetical protein BASA60_003497 [Batrachochytrium salamandrivorans]|nr:hypothetical protein BASA60_003497 [Batrachochytrium salamandrivorans]